MEQEHSPAEGTHHYENANVIVSDGTAWFESKTYKSLVAVCRVGVFVVAIVSFAFGAYVYQDRLNAQTGMSVNDVARETKDLRNLIDERKRERDAQFNELKSSTVTIIQFRAEFEAMNKRLDRIEAALDRIGPR